MELSAKSADGTSLLYNESFWTGKRSLSVNGKAAKKIGKKLFKIDESSDSGDAPSLAGEYEIVGSFITGVTVKTPSRESVVFAKNKWYDWLMMFFPFVGIIFGVAFCGAIGGGLSALFCFSAMIINVSVSRTKLPMVGKIFLQLFIAVIANLAWFGLYFIIAVWLLSAIS